MLENALKQEETDTKANLLEMDSNDAALVPLDKTVGLFVCFLLFDEKVPFPDQAFAAFAFRGLIPAAKSSLTFCAATKVEQVLLEMCRKA